MLLALDIGNSQIVCGVFDNNILVANWRLSTNPVKTSDEYEISIHSLLATQSINPARITHSIICSVVPPLTQVFEEVIQTSLGHSPAIVTCHSPHGLILKYENPEEIGADRLVNAAAAFEAFKRDLIIVDFGTATTFCTVTAEGEYLGGAIAPGLKSAADSLHLKTAKLPKVDLAIPENVIGRDTASSIQSGLLYGYAGLVDQIVGRIQKEVGVASYVLATGGLASVIIPISDKIQEIRPNLTLEGLALLHRRINAPCG